MNRQFDRLGKLVLWRIVATAALAVAAAGISAPLPAPASQASADVLTVFDLDSFIASQPNSQVGYDYLKLATALQGVVNRDKPRLFYHYKSNSIAQANGYKIDQFWLDQLSKSGEYLSGYTQVTVDSFDSILNEFSGEFNGVVVWDGAVPATANVASTAAGTENLLPVRLDLTAGSPYEKLVVQRKMPVALDLAGKFTGHGTIPDTTLASTGSAKNDAYVWAKIRYLDTGRTNPTLMAYALDAMSWPRPALDGEVVSAALPEKLSVGQQVDVSVTVRNVGKLSWAASSLDRLGALSGNQFTWSNFLNGGYSAGDVTNQRVFLGGNENVAPLEQTTFKFTITAPTQPGTYTFDAGMVRDGVAWYQDASIGRSIQVTTEPQPTANPVDSPVATSGGSAVYPDLFNSSLPNADYYIAKKAFFFDLSPDATTVPNDDPTQAVGTDYTTLTELLRSENAQAGKNIITIGGFVPWWLKYTTYVDPAASLAPVPAEWSMADTTSKYNAQVDADAYGLVGLSNASVYKSVPLQRNFKQQNDKGEKNNIVYKADTKYVTFYMGDYDSGAWTAGALPALWNDPKRGELPLAWGIDPGLSARVPQVYNYLYSTMSSKDYFVAGDNGAGYLNPMQLQAQNRPDGLPDFLQVWQDYNTNLYQQFDLDITGFLISGNSKTVPERVQKAYSAFSPLGVGTNAGYQLPVVTGTPFQTVTDLNSSSNAATYGEALAKALTDPQQFFIFRNILTSPTAVVGAVNYVKQKYPNLKFDVVDPYTNFRLYKNQVK